MKHNPSPTVSDEDTRKEVDDILNLLGDTADISGACTEMVCLIEHKERKARLAGRIEAGMQLRKSMISTSPFVEEILNPYLLEQRRCLKLT